MLLPLLGSSERSQDRARSSRSPAASAAPAMAGASWASVSSRGSPPACAIRPVRAVVEVDEEVVVDLHAAVRVAVDPQQPGAQLRVELVVPGGVERVGDVQALAVVGELEHVWPAV